MSESERPAVRRADGEAALTVVLAFAISAATQPLSTVIVPGEWIISAAAVSGGLLLAGFLLRRVRMPGAGVTAVLLALWVAAVTAIHLSDGALFGFLPTFETIDQVVGATQAASQQILEGVAPLEPTAPVTVLITAAFGILTIALDHVVLTARMPVMATVALVAVWLIPSIVTASPAGVLSFVLLAVAALALVRTETGTRELIVAGRPARGASTVAAAIGAGAIAIAIVVVAAAPAPGFRTGPGAGGGTTIDASLDLGESLRRPAATLVLRAHSSAPSIPYLRVATLSEFEGDVWQPDRLRSVPLTEAVMDPVVVDDGIALNEYATSIEIVQLNSAYLPVPFPAVDATGLTGLWRNVPYNRTLISTESSTQGQRYDVLSHVPRPTLEQIRAAEARFRESSVPLDQVPDDLPPVIAALAAEVTAGADTDYDKLIALQSWFRGNAFSYSLEAPVDGGFDGSGADAVARFLEVREGYCVHFASAFALMARSLGMPARIVVGFMPGPLSAQAVDGERVSEVTTDQFHAWPEVHFEGIGWIGFEPTKGLGIETRFRAEEIGGPDEDGDDDAASPTTAPTTAPEPTDAGPAPEFAEDPTDAGGSARQVDLRPYLLAAGVIVVVVLLPFGLRTLRLSVLRRRARSGAVGSAWRIVQETAIDLGAVVPGWETPRSFGARLVAERGAPADATGRLVAAVERANYAKPARVDAEAALADAERVRAALLASADGPARAAALLLPRSLVIAPGADTR